MEYFGLAGEMLRFDITADSGTCVLRRLPLSGDDVMTLAASLRRAVQSLDPQAPVYRTAFTTLYAGCEFVEGLGESDVLVIVPYGELAHLPWAALQGAAGALGSRVPLVQVPSMQSIDYLRSRVRHPVRSGVAAAAAPYDPAFMVGGLFAEAQKVAGLWGGNVLTGASASVTGVCEAIKGSRVVHLAAHGRFVPKSPLMSGIELEDGYLTAREVLRCRVDADLVVLSACGTGRSGIYEGTEAEGLVSAFLYAGAATVLASMWNVDSLATSFFVQQFYRDWADGMSKATAWLRACRAVREVGIDELLRVLDGRDAEATDDADLLTTAVHRGDLHVLVGDHDQAEGAYQVALGHATKLGYALDRRRITAMLRGLPDQLVRSTSAPARGQEEGPNRDRRRPWSAPFFWAGFMLTGDWQGTPSLLDASPTGRDR